MNPIAENITVGTVTEPANSPETAVAAAIAEPTELVCTVHGGDALPLSEFSLLQTGKRSTTCKACRALASNAWTAARADYRKVFHIALRARNLGLDVIMPNAKTWVAGDVTMLADGRTLDSVLAEQAATRQAEREQNAVIRAQQLADQKAIKDAAKLVKTEARSQTAIVAAQLRATAKAERQAAKLVKDAAAKLIADAAKAAKAEAKLIKSQNAASVASTKLAEREAAKLVKQTERQEKASLVAATRSAAKVIKQAERETARQAKLAERETARLAKLAAQPVKPVKPAKVVVNVPVVPETLTATEAVETLTELQEEQPEKSSAVSKLGNFFGNLVK